jgi:adenylate kinase
MNQSQHVPKVVFSFFGPPGSGKGTLAERLKAELGFEVLSTGNLCRLHIAQKTTLGEQLEELVHKGHLIPDALISAMVQEWLEEQIKLGKPVILDGYPRTAGQAISLMAFLKIHDGCHFRLVFVELADDEIVRRLLGRRVCSDNKCQAVYGMAFVGTACERCGALLVKRVDDKEEVIRERLRLYPSYRETLFKMYRDLGVHIEELNVAGMSMEEVFSTFKATL